MAKNKNWMVTTSGNPSLPEIKKHLIEAGFKVEEVYEEIGCITGSATEDVAERLRKMPGVTDVSEPPHSDVGPPDAPIS